MNKICPKCGGTRFYANQVQRCDVIVDGKNNWVENHGCYDAEDPFGPYTCVQCGKKFDSLDELSEEYLYAQLTLCSTDEMYYIRLPKGTTREKLKINITSAIRSFGEKTKLNGYYCFRTYTEDEQNYYGYNSKYDLKGVILVTNKEGCDTDVRIFENPKGQESKVRISIPSLEAFRKGRKISKIESDLYLIQSDYPYLCHAIVDGKVVKTGESPVIEITDVNELIHFQIRLTKEEYDQALVLYAYYEEGVVQYFSEADAKRQYLDYINKKEYPNYECWIDDMLKSGVFERV